MCKDFDIIKYISGLENIVLDRAVLERIALERNVSNVTDFSELSKQDKDLLDADVCMAAYSSPTHSASSASSHGDFQQSIGSQSITPKDKERFYNKAKQIYKRYDNEHMSDILDNGANLRWLDI